MRNNKPALVRGTLTVEPAEQECKSRAGVGGEGFRQTGVCPAATVATDIDGCFGRWGGSAFASQLAPLAALRPMPAKDRHRLPTSSTHDWASLKVHKPACRPIRTEFYI